MKSKGTKGKKCVFIDRDDTLIEDISYLAKPDGVRILDRAIEGIKLIKEHGFLLVIITNQSGIARGYFTEKDLAAIHKKMRALLRKGGADYDDLFYCPHHVDGVVEPFNVDCDCRKPKPGMFEKARKKRDIDFSRSFFVGDMQSDIEAGRSIGCKTVLIEGPKNIGANLKKEADYSAKNLLEAARWIIKENGKADDS